MQGKHFSAVRQKNAGSSNLPAMPRMAECSIRIPLRELSIAETSFKSVSEELRAHCNWFHSTSMFRKGLSSKCRQLWKF
jgi:hypothetical protein